MERLFSHLSDAKNLGMKLIGKREEHELMPALESAFLQRKRPAGRNWSDGRDLLTSQADMEISVSCGRRTRCHGRLPSHGKAGSQSGVAVPAQGGWQAWCSQKVTIDKCSAKPAAVEV